MSDAALYLLLFAASLGVYLPIYRFLVSKWAADYTVSRIESGDINLNYLLESGGVFDELARRVVTKFRQAATAELGQMSHQANTRDEVMADPQLMGIEAAGQLLNMVGMKRPPAMLQVKVAQALGQLIADNTDGASGDEFAQFKP